MKKLAAFLLAMCLVLAIGTGCASSNGDTDASNGEAESIKIGFLYMSFADALGSGFKRADITACEALGCEAVFVECADEAAYNNATESLIQSGVKGIVAGNMTGTMLELCKEAGVYCIYSGAAITDPDLLKMALDNEYYVGSVMQENVNAAYAAAKSAYDAGARNFIYLTLPAGMAPHYDARTEGFDAFFEDYPDATLVASVKAHIQNFPAEAEQLLAIYPELDAILDAYGSMATAATIYNAGRSETVKYACINAAEVEEVMQDGICTFSCGGQYPTQAFSFTLLYNALNGYQLIEDKSQPIYLDPIYITSYEAYQDYLVYFADDVEDPGFTAEQYIELANSHDFSVYEKCIDKYTLQDIIDYRS